MAITKEMVEAAWVALHNYISRTPPCYPSEHDAAEHILMAAEEAGWQVHFDEIARQEHYAHAARMQHADKVDKEHEMKARGIHPADAAKHHHDAEAAKHHHHHESHKKE